MNRIIIIGCIVLSVFLVNTGLSMGKKADDFSRYNEQIVMQNGRMKEEISRKQLLAPQPPVDMSKAFGLVINEMRYLEGYSGTSMNLTIPKTKDNDDISNYYMASQYHGVKELPVLIQVNKFSNETDMGAVLNDIYQLEMETDFKVTAINKDGDEVTVKGDIYGL